MQPDEPVATALPVPRVRGEIDVAQGAYGQRGNLELIAPHADDGFVVLWFNGDDVDARQGAARRSWSAGLHVPTGSRHDAARIAQVPLGPDFLEVVTLADGEVERWVWTPVGGFERRGAVAPSAAPPSATTNAGGALHLLVADGEAVVHLVGDTTAYPEVSWRRAGSLPVPAPVAAVDLAAEERGLVAQAVAGGVLLRARYRDGAWSPWLPQPGRWRSARLSAAADPPVGIDAAGAVQVGEQAAEGAADAVAAALSTLDGGTLEVVARRGSALLHGRRSAGSQAPIRLEPVVPLVWAAKA